MARKATRFLSGLNESEAGFRARLALSIAEGDRVRAIANAESKSVGTRRAPDLSRSIAELQTALRAAEQMQAGVADVDALRNHAAQHAQQAWLLLTGSTPEHIWGRCDCTLGSQGTT